MKQANGNCEKDRDVAGRGTVLLEVLLALALFAFASVVVVGGMHMSTEAVREVKLEARAADLAVTILSEVQMGMLEMSDAGPEEFDDPLADWTWQVTVTDDEDRIDPLVQMQRVVVEVVNVPEGYRYSLTGLMPGGGGE